MSTAVDTASSRLSYRTWFRMTFVAIGCMEVFFAVVSMRGLREMMSQFGIPEQVVNSPHYLDAMFWVVLHMSFIGIITISLGILVREPSALRWLPRIFVCFHSVYAFLDIRASDSPLGTGLYQGSASLITPIISCTLLLAMLHLALRSLRARIE